MKSHREDGRSSRETVVAMWIALLRAGCPAEVWIPRRVWRNTLRMVCEVESTMGMRDRTKTAKDFGLIEVEPGHRTREGRIKLREPGADGQFIPLEIDLDELFDGASVCVPEAARR